MKKIKPSSIHEEMLFTPKALNIKSETAEIGYTVSCYDGYAIGVLNDVEIQEAPATIIITYPTCADITTEQYMECLEYRGIDIDDVDYDKPKNRFPEDICMLLGKVIPQQVLKAFNIA